MKNDDPMKKHLLLAIDCTFQMINHQCARNGCACPAEYGSNGLRSKILKVRILTNASSACIQPQQPCDQQLMTTLSVLHW